MLLIITSTGDKLFGFSNIDDLEQPRTTQRFFSEFFVQFLDAAHISTLNCDEMCGDRPRQPAYKIFSIKCRLSSPSPDPLGLSRPAQALVK